MSNLKQMTCTEFWNNINNPTYDYAKKVRIFKVLERKLTQSEIDKIVKENVNDI